nr:DUF3489 domain-containing protein [Nitrosomonas nitrosa]
MAKSKKAPVRRAAKTIKQPAADRKPRQHTKHVKLIEMLRRPDGATVAQIAKALNWQPHTVRGAMSGALKKKLGLTITSEKPEGGERVYRIA